MWFGGSDMAATIYIICLILGGGLLLLSATFSGHHGDASFDAHPSGDASFDQGSADIHHDVATNGHHSTFTVANWFSVQFAIYFIAVFGLIGTTLTYASTTSAQTVMAASMIGGIVVGQGVHQTMRYLKRTGCSSEVAAEDFLNKPARVTINIDPPRQGEVALSVNSGERFVCAVARRPDDKFRVGDRVVVVTFRNGVAEVVSREEFEFVSGKSVGAAS